MPTADHVLEQLEKQGYSMLEGFLTEEQLELLRAVRSAVPARMWACCLVCFASLQC
jgi:hypothetical protein